MLGAFVALDLFLFYVFWEVMLIPMYLMIGIWGGQRRLYASIKFVIYTMVGSLLMLVAIFYLYVQYHAVHRQLHASTSTKLSHVVAAVHARRCWCFARVRAGVRHQGADVPAPHLVARRARRGADRRLGDPGRRAAEVRHLRLPALRDAAVPARRARPGRRCSRSWRSSASSTARWSRSRRTTSRSWSRTRRSSHLGLRACSASSTLTATGVQGAIYQMLAHGISTGGLFLGVGVLYERRHTRRIAEFGGLVEADAGVRGLFLVIVHGARSGLPGAVGLRRRVPGAARHVHRRQDLGRTGTVDFLPVPKAAGRRWRRARVILGARCTCSTCSRR